MIARPEFGSEAGNNIIVINSQDNGSTKERGTNRNFYILRGELYYLVFYPSDGLPQAIDPLVF